MIVCLVALGNIRGSFQRRMELGPSAVGGRWLLDGLRRAEIKDRVNVSRIRRKLGLSHNGAGSIRSVPGLGYSLTVL